MDFCATLPHDKICSLLGLATETADFMTWRADSSKPVSGVFRAIGKASLKKGKILLVLEEVDHGLEFKGQGSSWVPSWVWSKGFKAGIRNLADKETVPYFGSSDCLEVKSLKGILFDSIAY
jgi:hypothetical protein